MIIIAILIGFILIAAAGYGVMRQRSQAGKAITAAPSQVPGSATPAASAEQQPQPTDQAQQSPVMPPTQTPTDPTVPTDQTPPVAPAV